MNVLDLLPISRGTCIKMYEIIKKKCMHIHLALFKPKLKNLKYLANRLLALLVRHYVN